MVIVLPSDKRRAHPEQPPNEAADLGSTATKRGMGQQDSAIGSSAPKRSGNTPHLKGANRNEPSNRPTGNSHRVSNPGVKSDSRDNPTSMGEVV